MRVWFAAHTNTKHENDVLLHTYNICVIYIVVVVVDILLRGGRGGGEMDFFLLSGGVDGPGLDRLAAAASLAAGGF